MPIFNLRPGPHEAARFGFLILNVPVYLTGQVRTDSDYGINVESVNITQAAPFIGITTRFWGTPGDPPHDERRCRFPEGEGGLCTGPFGHPTFGPNSFDSGVARPFLTLPTSCTPSGAGLRFDVSVESWEDPPVKRFASFETTQESPNQTQPLGTSECDRVPFGPKVNVQPTTDEAETPTGLEVQLEVPTGGLNNPVGISQSHLKDAAVTLPQGMTLNPGYADGVTYCSPAQMGLTTGSAAEIHFNKAPATCPDASQLGEVRIDSPLVAEPLLGAVYVAQQNDPSVSGTENPFDSLLGIYVVAQGAGQVIKLAGKVSPDPETGQITTTFLNNPQIPFSRFSLKFKGGQRAPLATPPLCGAHTVEAKLTPWARPDSPVTVTDSIEIHSGPNGGPCPSGAAPPFRPGLVAGTQNNAAGSYSPFNLRLTRKDGEQEFTRFSIKLPPGIIGKLAGVPYCPDAAIAAGRLRTGTEEILSPSCPVASQVGRTEVGVGVGSLQVSTPGKIYLAGPYHGSPVSVVAITAAKAGPFDLGVVVIRQALDVNPETAEVFVDATGSDPIPHIINGVVVHARDIRVYVDRPAFMLNPTNCERTSTASTVLGSGLDFVSAIDDNPITVTSPFQAADCAALDFNPNLKLSLSGATKRGKNPAFTAVLTAKPGEANIAKSVVVLPRSQFLDNAHIGTVCTRVQFNQGNVPGEKCPAGAIYGHAQAITPLLDVPVEGPVFLRSNNGERELPDLVAALHGPQADFNLVGFVDSVSHKLRSGERVSNIRNIFASVPDAPVTKFTLQMFGGNKGLLENSTNLCRKPNRAEVSFTGQNGKLATYKRVLKVKCGKKKRRKHGKQTR